MATASCSSQSIRASSERSSSCGPRALEKESDPHETNASLMTGVRNRIDAFVSWGSDSFSSARGPQLLDRSDEARIDWDEQEAVATGPGS